MGTWKIYGVLLHSMQFSIDDSVPFYLSEEKKEELKFDCETDEVETKKIHTFPTHKYNKTKNRFT